MFVLVLTYLILAQGTLTPRTVHSGPLPMDLCRGAAVLLNDPALPEIINGKFVVLGAACQPEA